jgi:HAD superfamily hydrolase (TIGR01549 family)
MKLIIFDIDGTLCHSKYVDDKCYITAFKKALNIDIANTDWNTYKHVTDQTITSEILKLHNMEAYPETINMVIDYYAEELKACLQNDEFAFQEIPGTRNLIKYLQSDKQNYIVGIATGGFLRTAKFKLNSVGLNIEEEFIYSSSSHETKHDMIKAFISDTKANGTKLDKVYYVGDREYDYKTATELNIEFIGIDIDKNGKLKNLGAKYVTTNYKPMKKFLDLL